MNIGFMCLHYGSEFLEASLKSVEPFVDKYLIAYTPKPSFSFRTDIECPDTEENMKEIADRVLGDKLIWTNKIYHHEGHHRNEIYSHVNQNDTIIVTDSDEVWKDAGKALRDAENIEAHGIMIDGFINFWKSFDYIVHDGFRPFRIIKPKYPRNKQDVLKATIYHLGYMIRPETMRYKLAIHGHRNDIDQVHGSPENYFEKWNSWTRPGCGVTKLHPASRDIWIDAEKYDGKKPVL